MGDRYRVEHDGARAFITRDGGTVLDVVFGNEAFARKVVELLNADAEWNLTRTREPVPPIALTLDDDEPPTSTVLTAAHFAVLGSDENLATLATNAYNAQVQAAWDPDGGRPFSPNVLAAAALTGWGNPVAVPERLPGLTAKLKAP